MTTKADELRSLTPDQLETTIEEGRSELFNLRNELAETGKCEKSHRIPEVKREISRALTLLAEKRKKG